MKVKRFAAFLSVLVLAAPLFAGGGGQAQGGRQATAPTLGTGRISYPVNTDVTLTYWTGLTPALQGTITNMSETAFARGLQERTGIKLEFLHPPSATINEQFNMIVASRDFPDIMEHNWLLFPGGPERAIDEGIIVPLNDYLESYAPNLTDYLRANPRHDRMVKTDAGTYFVFPFIRGDDRLCVFNGIYIRQDWLDEFGLDVPVTFDDWHRMLTVFRDRKGVAPLAIGLTLDDRWFSNFVWGLGIARDWYLGDDGRVRWGGIEPAFRYFVETMARWYREGLIDPDFVSLTHPQIAQRMTTGRAGVSVGNLGRDMGGWTPVARTADPAFRLVAVQPPVRNRGDQIRMLQIDNPFTGLGTPAITTANRNRELTARLFDWGYSPEGYTYHNFGVQGVAHTMVNGIPTYTPEITSNPRGWSMSTAIAFHARASYNGPFVQSFEYQLQFFALPEQAAAPDIWMRGIADPFRHRVPPITPSASEATQMAQIMNSVNTYFQESLTRFILGTDPINDTTWNNYVRTIEQYGIQRAIDIQNAALGRFNNR